MSTQKEPKTLRELRDFLNNQVDDQFLDRRFIIQQENEIHCLHFMDLASEDHFYDEDNPDCGSMTREQWKEHWQAYDEEPKDFVHELKVGIPQGCPMFGEDF